VALFTKSVAFALFLLAAAAVALAQEPMAAPTAVSAWKMRYLFDENDSVLTLTGFAFPSAQRGMACGILEKRKYNVLVGTRQVQTPVVLVTSDGGKKWSVIEVKGLPDNSVPNSIFFLDDSTGWLVSDDGIWFTNESGRAWKRISSLKNLLSVYFLSPTRGFAVGGDKQALGTSDGGATWTPIPAAAEPETTIDWTVYSSVAFTPDRKGGIISGFSRAPRHQKTPAWMDPEGGRHERQVPNVVIFLDTHDGGQTWSSQTSSLFGEVTKASFAPGGVGLGLLEFHDQFPWPSEVYSLTLANGVSDRAFRQNDRAITDVICNPAGDSFLAGYESVGDIHPSPIPGKVKILKSADMKNWTEMSVDYRAVARRVWLAAPAGGSVWAATDTGMIMELPKE
jgi:hypothetical protein